MSVRLRHGRIELALHELASPAGSERPGARLLLLHGLGLSSPASLPRALGAWPGPVYALDFTGHGASTVPRAGGYTAELLMADADTALGHLGPSTVCGSGLGAYVALLLAGAHPEAVRGAILCDGPGLAGGGSQPLAPLLASVDDSDPGPPDPFALYELARDFRPPDYATAFVRQTTHLSGREHPVSVCARQRPDWLAAVVEEPGVEVRELDEALVAYGAGDD